MDQMSLVASSPTLRWTDEACKALDDIFESFTTLGRFIRRISIRLGADSEIRSAYRDVARAYFRFWREAAMAQRRNEILDPNALNAALDEISKMEDEFARASSALLKP